jgi:hypothetical protein
MSSIFADQQRLRDTSPIAGAGGREGVAGSQPTSTCTSRDMHCKKELAVFPSPAGMSLIKLFLGGNNLVFSCPERVWSVTSRLGTGKWLTLFYSVEPK